jgi:predicted nucleic-acid-binding protein
MIGLDTNILVRFLTRDDPAQSRAAQAVLTQQLSAESPGWISTVVLAETVWVLRRRFGYSRDDVVDVIDSLLSTDVLVLEAENAVNDAIADTRLLGVDFTDAFIASIGRRAGCDFTLTFDKGASRLPDFKLAT